MERIKNIKDQLISQVCNQMGDLKKVDTKELGEVVDMIKDLSETLYYCEIYKQMEEAEKQPIERNNYYYTERYYRDMDKDSQQRMYYHDETTNNDQTQPKQAVYYTESDYPISFYDAWEGRSPIKRKMYMESKATHQNNNKIMKDLENYMSELTSDIIEMLDKATPEEKTIVQNKINTLSNKIQNV